MGIDYHSYVVYGVLVPRSTVEPLEKKPYVDHEHPVPPGADFCPVCGKQLFTTERQLPFDSADSWLSVYSRSSETPEDELVVLGREVSGNKLFDVPFDDGNIYPIKPSKRVLDRTKSELEAVGLLNDTLGLYNVLHISY